MMNDKEAAEYANKYAQAIPAVRCGGGGPLTDLRDQAVLGLLDSFSAQYIMAKANAMSKTAAEVIGDLVRSDIAAAS